MNIVESTKDSILNSAEHLFARDGYHATTLRSITTRAGVNLAAVNYHFGSKQALLSAILDRRLVPLNEIRFKAVEGVLSNAQKRGQRPGVKAIMRAFIEPTLRFKDSGAGARNFILLISRASFETQAVTRKIIFELITPLIELLLRALKEVYPDKDEQLLLWQFNFFIGSLAHTMRLCSMDNLPRPLTDCADLDTESMIDMLVDFVSAGFNAP